MSEKLAVVDVVAEEDLLRARIYGLLGRLLATPPSAALLAELATLATADRGEGGGPIGDALGALAAAARGTTEDAAREEYDALFIGMVRGELVPYASYYITGFLHERPLAKLRRDMARLGIAAAENASDPEDHIAALCEMMAGLATGAFGAPADLATQHRFFETHLAPWAGRFFEDLERAPSAALYRPVGALGRAFIGVEIEAFAMAA